MTALKSTAIIPIVSMMNTRRGCGRTQIVGWIAGTGMMNNCSVIFRISRKIHQDIYLLILNITEQLFIIPVPAIHPTICVRPQPLRVFIIDTIGIIAVDFKAVMVVIFQYRLNKESQGMIAKITRDITYSQDLR